MLTTIPTGNKAMDSMQSTWQSQLNALLKNPLNNAATLSGVQLASGVTVINHKLGRVPQGWFLTDIQGAATVFRSAAFNNLTLTLTSSAAVTVNLGVF